MILLRSIVTVGSLTMVSRILGFIRDILIAAIVGVGPVADAFIVAFKLPNFFRRLFAEGAFSAAFVPLFTQRMVAEGKDVAREFAQEVLSIALITLLILVTLLQVAMPWAMHGIAPGFTDDPYRFDLAVTLAQITFPYLLFISLASQLSGILNALGRFAAAAAAPIVLNLFLIAAMLGLAPYLETPGHALAWGVAAAGVAQFLGLVFACHRAGFALRLPRPRLTPRVRQFLILMAPGVIGAGVYQINLLIDIVIASLLPQGSVSFLYFADRINQLPLGVVGVAVGTALLPLLSRQIREGKVSEAADSMNRAAEFALLLTIPAAAALLVVPELVVGALFERGAFGAAETAATAAALAAYAAGLPAFVLVKVLAPGFFARGDTITPVKVAAVCVVLNIGLNLLLMGPFLHVGIALATTISSWVNAFFLYRILARRGDFAPDARLCRTVPRVVACAAVMAATLWLAASGLDGFLDPGSWHRAAALTAVVALGMGVFSLLAFVSGAARLADLKAMLDRSPG